MAQDKAIRWISVPLPEGAPPDETVWISVARLDASWKKQRKQYIGPGGCGRAIGNRYGKFGFWIERGEAIWIPWVGLDHDEIAFTDGRHRFAWLRDHGVQSMPIDVDPEIADAMKKRFGSLERKSSCRHENQ